MGLLGSDPPFSPMATPAPQPPSSWPEIQLVRPWTDHENPMRGRPVVVLFFTLLVQSRQVALAP